MYKLILTSKISLHTIYNIHTNNNLYETKYIFGLKNLNKEISQLSEYLRIKHIKSFANVYRGKQFDLSS